jgi:methyl-accepting chemotaxis protein
MADVHAAADEIKGMIRQWFDANDLDQTLEGLHEIPRAVQESFKQLADELSENTNLSDRIHEAVAEAGARMTGIADELESQLTFGVQRS